MSLELIKKIFSASKNQNTWTLTLLDADQDERGVYYNCFDVPLAPEDALSNIITDLAEGFEKEQNKPENAYSRVVEFDGTTDKNTIYTLSRRDEKYRELVDKLEYAVANSDIEHTPNSETNAYIIHGNINIDTSFQCKYTDLSTSNEMEIEKKIIAREGYLKTGQVIKLKALNNNLMAVIK